jgi:hypothetical protein
LSRMTAVHSLVPVPIVSMAPYEAITQTYLENLVH